MAIWVLEHQTLAIHASNIASTSLEPDGLHNRGILLVKVSAKSTRDGICAKISIAAAGQR